MALVACTQLKEPDLRYTKLTGEWLVGIDRGPVPSEQRMERASWNTPELLIFDTNFVFWVCATRKYLSWILKNFYERFFVLILSTSTLLPLRVRYRGAPLSPRTTVQYKTLGRRRELGSFGPGKYLKAERLFCLLFLSFSENVI